MAGMARTVVRLALVVLGAVLFASLLAAALVLALVGLGRVAWSRLTGRPLRPWAFRVDPHAQWNRFRAAANPRPATDGEVRPGRYQVPADVVDVEARPARRDSGRERPRRPDFQEE